MNALHEEHPRQRQLAFCLLTASLFSLFLLRPTVCEAQPGNRPVPVLEVIAAEHALDQAALDALVGKQATITLRNGKVDQNVTLKEFVTVGKEARIKIIVGTPEGENRSKRYVVKQLYRVRIDEAEYAVNYLPSQKAAVLQDLAARQSAVNENLRGTGRIWEAFTPEETAQTIADDKEVLSKVGQYFSALPLRLHETKYFLFYTDMPPNQLAPYIVQLDKMNELLGEAFGFPAGHNVWKGKAVIVVFMDSTSFVAFERQFMDYPVDLRTSQGLCHADPTGKVVISAYRGEDPGHFGQLLVHETTHGYLHRYYTTVHIPSWINEGIADWIANRVVPQSDSVKNRRTQSQQVLKQSGTLGGAFFNSDQIPPEFYGTASTLVDMMIRQSPDQFKAFLDGVKEGLDWQDSLQRAYGMSANELTAFYGRSIGIPQLTP